MKKKIIEYCMVFALIVLLILNFSKNLIGKNFVGTPTFEGFQNDSEYLVFSKIFQDKYSLGKNKYGLSCVMNENNERLDNIWNIIQNYKDEKINLKEYSSQLGLQGYVFSFLYNKIHMPFWMMKLICCTILAITIMLICYIICEKYGRLMGGIFYITFLLSPWVVAFARNLYWVEFTWFLPILFGLILSTDYKKKKKLIPCIFMAVLIKCLCGYEYISTIMLDTIAFFIVDFFITKEKEQRKEIVKTTVIVGITCLSAFIIALCTHAILRGEGNILQGIESIYKNDILRRTIIVSDKETFPKVYQESLNASVKETIEKYFNWDSNVITGIDGKYFRLIFVGTIAIIIYDILKKKENCYRNMVMFLLFLATTLSWIILGKSHSYIHTHINFVLWYFGFVQICLYEIIQFICGKTYEIGGKIEKGEKKI